MKKAIILPVLLIISLKSLCQGTANSNLSSIVESSIEITKNSNQPSLDEKKKEPQTDTVLLKKLIEIQDMLSGLESKLKKSIVDSIKLLPNLINTELQNQIDAIIKENNINKNIIQNNESDKKKYELEKNNNQINSESQKSQIQELTTNIQELKINSSKEWSSYVEKLLQSEKFISDDLASSLRNHISTPSLQSKLDTFLINSKIIKASEEFLYEGKGSFNLIYPNLKNGISNSKFTAQIKAKKEMLNMYSLFIIYADALINKLESIKASKNVDTRTDELTNWKFYQFAILFPFLKDNITKNYKIHTPLNIDTKAL